MGRGQPHGIGIDVEGWEQSAVGDTEVPLEQGDTEVPFIPSFSAVPAGAGGGCARLPLGLFPLQ